LSKASRRSSRATRGGAGRPVAGGPAAGGPGASTGRPAGQTPPAGSQAGRPASPRGTGSRPAGSRPAGSSRPRRTLYQPSFYERHRTALFAGGAAIIVALVGAFFFFSVTATAYSCGTTPAPLPSGTPLPDGSPALLGQSQPDMGNLHIEIGSKQKYAYCPPASGPHYNNPGIDGPIPAKFYGPDDGTRPQGWIHNMEHGAVVVLYNCKLGACDDATQAALQAIPVGFPDSPICGKQAGVLAPVVARFDDMPTEFAALVWDRVLYMNTLDVNEIKTFYATEAERTNPESQCARPSPSPSGAPSSAPSSAPSAGSSSAPSSARAPTASPSAS